MDSLLTLFLPMGTECVHLLIGCALRPSPRAAERRKSQRAKRTASCALFHDYWRPGKSFFKATLGDWKIDPATQYATHCKKKEDLNHFFLFPVALRTALRLRRGKVSCPPKRPCRRFRRLAPASPDPTHHPEGFAQVRQHATVVGLQRYAVGPMACYTPSEPTHHPKGFAQVQRHTAVVGHATVVG